MATTLPQLLERSFSNPEPDNDGTYQQLAFWLSTQATSVGRHAAGLRPFRQGEFGSGAASPSEAHRRAANQLVRKLQARLAVAAQRLDERTARAPSPRALAQFTSAKASAGRLVKLAEGVWEFYHELFSQRTGPMGRHLLAADRIALDCYRAVYSQLGTPRSVPSPPPFSFQESALAPATFRRGVSVSRLGRNANPFPLVKLPYHRLMNPWTLGAVTHEVSHNLQSDLGLWQQVPNVIATRLHGQGIPPEVVRIWTRWHKEIFADLCGLLLAGPDYVGSLMDVVGLSHRQVAAFNPNGVHPVPLLRVLINTELLERIGLADRAGAYRNAWRRLYPHGLARSLPPQLMQSFPVACASVVKSVCFTTYHALGRRSLVQLLPFTPQHDAMISEAARRLRSGTNPGVVPERFLIAASRRALRGGGDPDTIARNFYICLADR